MKAFVEENGMRMMGYSPLGSGDRPWKTKEDPVLLEDPKLKEIASKYGKTVAHICIRYQVRIDIISLELNYSLDVIINHLINFSIDR